MPSSAVRRIASLLAAIMLGLATGMVAVAPAASAHVDVNEYTPSLGEVIQSTPAEITLSMSSDPGNIGVRLFHRDGREVPLTGNGPELSGSTVVVRPPSLDVGTYVLTWESSGPDGHVAAGQSHFSVGQPDGDPVDLTSGVDQSVSPAVKISQWLGYVALAVAFGAAWLALTGTAGSARRRRILAVSAAIMVAAAEAVRLLLVASTFDDSLGSGLAAILGSRPNGIGWMIIAAGIMLIATARPRLAVAGVTAVAFGDVLTGHLASASNWQLVTALGAVHLIAVCVWVGPIAAHVIAGRRGKAANLEFAGRFTMWAAAAFVAIAASGIALASIRMGGLTLTSLFSREYGLTLLYKWGILLAFVAPIGAYHAGKVLLRKAREYESATSATTAESSRAAGSEPAADPSEAASANPDPPVSEAAARGTSGRLTLLTITVELAALVAITFLGASLSGMPPSPTTVVSSTGTQTQDLLAVPASFEECSTGSGGSDQLLCIERYLTGVANTEGMPVALNEITRRWQAGDEWIQKYCHVIGHKIGRLGYRMFKDIPTAFRQGSDPCDYGYLHGVIEGAASDFSDDELQAAMTTLCEEVGDLTNHTYRQCIHGLGHAAARRVNNDLPRAMAFCDVFYVEGSDTVRETDEDGLKFNLCASGISMEWNTQPKAMEAGKLPIGAPGTLMAECVALPARFHTSCIEYATSGLGGKYEREIEARDWCDKNLEEPLACYWSIGRDVIWSPTVTPEQAIEVCTGGKQGVYPQECITRSLGSVATIKLDASAIDSWCVHVPDEYKFLCPMVRNSMEVQIAQTVKGSIVDQPAAPAGSPE